MDENRKLTIDGLVLEGGAMRGMYTAGVLDTFMDREITADRIVGVSAGALFGVNLLSGQKGRVIRYNKKYNGDPDYLGIRPLLKEGNIVSTEYAYVRVPHELDPFDDAAFRASESEFTAVLTNVHTGLAEYHRIDSVFDKMDTLRASGSMPFVSTPVEIDGKRYLDGAIADSIPFRWMLEQGAGKTVAVLTRDISYREKDSYPWFSWLYRRKYPAFAQQLNRHHEMYRRQLAELKQLETEGRVFVIRPSEPILIRRTEKDPAKLQAVYDLGVRDALSQMEKLEKYLGE